MAENFTATTWVDGSSPDITATQLNRIEQGIEDAHAGVIDDGAIGTDQLADGAVTNAKVASGLSADKLTAGTLPIARVADGAVTNAKLASGIDASKLTTGTLPIARIADAAVTNAKLADGAVTNEKLRDSTAMSVIGRTWNSTGDPADIAAASDGAVLRRSGSRLEFGQVASAGIADAAVTSAKLAAGSNEEAWVRSRIAALTGPNFVGAYAFLRHASAVGTSTGATRAGSDLRYTDVTDTLAGGAPSGTWRCMGFSGSGGNGTLWLRIA